MNTQNREIGVATILYSEDGKPLSSYFKPTVMFSADTKMLDQLSNVEGPDAESVKTNSELVMGAWFSNLNDIELADREEFSVVGEVLQCDKYQSGKIKRCSVKFVLKKLTTHSHLS